MNEKTYEPELSPLGKAIAGINKIQDDYYDERLIEYNEKLVTNLKGIAKTIDADYKEGRSELEVFIFDLESNIRNEKYKRDLRISEHKNKWRS